jgi:hypothetical protein
MRQPNPRLCQPATLASDSMTTLTLQSVRRRLQIRDALRYRDDTNLRCPSPITQLLTISRVNCCVPIKSVSCPDHSPKADVTTLKVFRSHTSYRSLLNGFSSRSLRPLRKASSSWAFACSVVKVGPLRGVGVDLRAIVTG